MKKKWVWLIVQFLVVCYIALFIVPDILMWSPLNLTMDKIDIMAGRRGYERHLLYIKIVDRVQETDISQLYRRLIGEPPAPVWRTVNIFSPGSGISPHYAYHGGLGAVYTLTRIYETSDFTDEAKKSSLINFFRLLQMDNNYFRAEKYVHSLWIFSHTGKKVTVQDLPDIPKNE
jgi:hypothetical protein